MLALLNPQVLKVGALAVVLVASYLAATRFISNYQAMSANAAMYEGVQENNNAVINSLNEQIKEREAQVSQYQREVQAQRREKERVTHELRTILSSDKVQGWASQPLPSDVDEWLRRIESRDTTPANTKTATSRTYYADTSPAAGR